MNAALPKGSAVGSAATSDIYASVVTFPDDLFVSTTGPGRQSKRRALG